MEITLRLITGVAWAYAYWRIIIVSRQDRTYGVPLFAAALNLSWESIYSIGGAARWSNYGTGVHVQIAINWVWLFLDLGIAATVIRYGRREFPSMTRTSFLLMLTAISALAAMLQASFLLKFPPEEAAQLTALLQNVYMSGAYISMALVRADRRGQRLDVAVAKLIGTLVATISVSLIGGFSSGFLVLGISCFFLDVAYIFILRRLPPYLNSSDRPAVSPKADVAAPEHKRTLARKCGRI